MRGFGPVCLRAEGLHAACHATHRPTKRIHLDRGGGIGAAEIAGLDVFLEHRGLAGRRNGLRPGQRRERASIARLTPEAARSGGNQRRRTPNSGCCRLFPGADDVR